MYVFFFLCMRAIVGFFFFFSSRRRHTRWNCDWSSDVCSSDLSSPSGRSRQTAGFAPPPAAAEANPRCWTVMCASRSPSVHSEQGVARPRSSAVTKDTTSTLVRTARLSSSRISVAIEHHSCRHVLRSVTGPDDPRSLRPDATDSGITTSRSGLAWAWPGAGRSPPSSARRARPDLADRGYEQVGDEIGPTPLRAVAGRQADQLSGVLLEGARNRLVGQAVVPAPDVGGRNITPGRPSDRLRAREGCLRPQQRDGGIGPVRRAVVEQCRAGTVRAHHKAAVRPDLHVLSAQLLRIGAAVRRAGLGQAREAVPDVGDRGREEHQMPDRPVRPGRRFADHQASIGVPAEHHVAKAVQRRADRPRIVVKISQPTGFAAARQVWADRRDSLLAKGLDDIVPDPRPEEAAVNQYRGHIMWPVIDHGRHLLANLRVNGRNSNLRAELSQDIGNAQRWRCAISRLGSLKVKYAALVT